MKNYHQLAVELSKITLDCAGFPLFYPMKFPDFFLIFTKTFWSKKHIYSF